MLTSRNKLNKTKNQNSLKIMARSSTTNGLMLRKVRTGKTKNRTYRMQNKSY